LHGFAVGAWDTLRGERGPPLAGLAEQLGGCGLYVLGANAIERYTEAYFQKWILSGSFGRHSISAYQVSAFLAPDVVTITAKRLP
jgi:hypothetical protein